jgi:NTE family protein
MNLADQEAAGAVPEVASATGRKVVNLALQGGGMHGAFTWGVLDRLLEDERLSFEGVAASSAGAVNGVVLVEGLITVAREGARSALRAFRQKLSAGATRGIFRPSWIDKMNPRRGLDHSPNFLFLESLTFYLSPYQLNPFNINPLKKLLEENVDFDRIRRQNKIKFFVCATDVRTAKVKVFTADTLRADHVLASTCLPMLMHAVEIDGEYYWDGGYARNPALFPLVYECESRDIVMVHITPADRAEVPTTSLGIMNRMQEISFNTSLIREMRGIAFVNKRIDEGKMTGDKTILMHLIEAQDVFRDFTASSRLNGDWDFLMDLFDKGRARADAWLKANFERIGVESTVDLEEKYF